MSKDKPIKFKDFDEAVEELDIPDISFVIKGTSYSLPGQISAKVVLKQMEFLASGNVLQTEGIPEWLELLIGKENLKSILDDGASWQQVNDLAQWLLASYGVAPEAELEEALEKIVDKEDNSDADPK